MASFNTVYVELQTRTTRIETGYRFAEAILKVKTAVFAVGYDLQAGFFLQSYRIADALVFD